MKTLTIPKALPRIERFQKLGLGLFLHWGLYSLVEKGEWAWNILKLDAKSYRSLIHRFDAAEFDPRGLAHLARACGFRYIVLTTRHHDGFSLYDTRGLSTFDACHSLADRDLVAEFVEGCRAEGILPFFYHTTLDWTWQDQSTEELGEDDFQDYLDYLCESVEILCRHYGDVGGFWFDGNWSRPDSDWKEDRLYHTIRQYQPNAIIVNNTGLFARGQTGHPEIDCLTYEQGLPEAPDQTEWPKYLAGEMCQTFNHHWGYARDDFHYLSLKEIIENYAQCRKVGMNYLFNVGPLGSGAIPGLEKEILIRFGQWMDGTGHSLLDTVPTSIQSDSPDVFMMQGVNGFYGVVFGLGIKGNAAVTVDTDGSKLVTLTDIPEPIKLARWLDNGEQLEIKRLSEDSYNIRLTANPYGRNQVVRVFHLA